MSPTTVRLLTFNTLFRGSARARLRALGAVLERSEYDIVCLQEVMSTRNLGALREVATSYRQVGYAPVFPMIRGGLVTLSRLPLTGRQFSLFRPARPVRREWVILKGALLTHHQVGDLRLTVVNTHLSANRDDDWSPQNRYTRVEAAELRQLGRVVRAAGPGTPLVVAGDFNVPRDSSTYGEFVRASGLRDALAGDREPTFRPTPRWPEPPAIDQVLFSVPPALAVEARAELVLRERVRLADGRMEYLSDHVGIGVELRIRPTDQGPEQR
ncbi:endonuclease/exonuclease/phosphatase family protein [Kitasatospora sp. NBC_01266]|uniref:endonuclease/exonuclease/phosphatase family protein n=1 Tax=Kitasatospora sp. NBC_01266 TaxID=2903572 RepID=UPI002E3242D4|nr:endonuclease/exonuclease/phosphatase family protein [Kitasatospora sp. NBC_01266]